MRIRLHHLVLGAVIAPACLCAAQDGRRADPLNKPEDLLEQVLRALPADPHVIVSPDGRVIVRSGASIVQDGRAEPVLELICQGRTMALHDRPAATHDLYPVPEGFCDMLAIGLGSRNGGGERR